METMQNHPYKPFIPKDAKVLLLGSAPPYRFCTGNANDLKNKDMDYYYGSNSNLLWEILFNAFEPDKIDSISSLRSLEENRKIKTAYQIDFLQSFLARNQLGMADILLKFSRKGTSAEDYKLTVLEYQDILGILYNNSSLTKILCTSKNRVHYWLMDYLKQQKHYDLIEIRDNGNSLILKNYPHREIKIGILPSPSARSVMRYANKTEFLQQVSQIYKQAITNDE
ncbi:MAG TPA: uracil-DNA glycosylase family protein [Candidatus Cloacimonas acidaminovorans]|nr:uracil-DNA glycosylase family protein [Candidatus Cloacimonas acidaminovorans]